MIKVRLSGRKLAPDWLIYCENMNEMIKYSEN